jgi:hypothetical protein
MIQGKNARLLCFYWSQSSCIPPVSSYLEQELGKPIRTVNDYPNSNHEGRLPARPMLPSITVIDFIRLSPVSHMVMHVPLSKYSQILSYGQPGGRYTQDNPLAFGRLCIGMRGRLALPAGGADVSTSSTDTCTSPLGPVSTSLYISPKIYLPSVSSSDRVSRKL